jgi:hypothetical protein
MQQTPTLGTIITENAFRDAIHVAITPIEAPCDLNPGEHVDPFGWPQGNHVGIVDPFLTEPVKKGQKFWLCLYQNSVTSLRHVWTHPAFVARPPEVSRAK